MKQLITHANNNHNEKLFEILEATNKYEKDGKHTVMEQLFYNVNDVVGGFFGNENNRNTMIFQLTKRMYNTPTFYNDRLTDATNYIDDIVFEYEYTSFTGKLLVEALSTTYGGLGVFVTDKYFNTHTIKSEFINEEPNFGTIKIQQVTTSGFSTIDEENIVDRSGNSIENFKPFDLVVLSNKSNLSNVAQYQSSVQRLEGQKMEDFPIPAIAVKYIVQSGYNQTIEDGIYTVVDLTTLAVSGGTLAIATNLTKIRRTMYIADVISSVGSLSTSTLKHEGEEYAHLVEVINLISAISGGINLSLDGYHSYKNFKGALKASKDLADEAVQIQKQIGMLTDNINNMSAQELDVFVGAKNLNNELLYEAAINDYMKLASKDLKDANVIGDIEKIEKIEKAFKRIKSAKNLLSSADISPNLNTFLNALEDRELESLVRTYIANSDDNLKLFEDALITDEIDDFIDIFALSKRFNINIPNCK